MYFEGFNNLNYKLYYVHSPLSIVVKLSWHANFVRGRSETLMSRQFILTFLAWDIIMLIRQPHNSIIIILLNFAKKRKLYIRKNQLCVSSAENREWWTDLANFGFNFVIKKTMKNSNLIFLYKLSNIRCSSLLSEIIFVLRL